MAAAASQKDRRRRVPVTIGIGFLFLLALGVRIPFMRQSAFMSAHPIMLDDWIWQFWAREHWQHGLSNISNVTPKTYLGFHYLLWAVGEVYALTSPDFHVPSMTLNYMMKAPLIAFDLFIVLLIMMATRRLAAQMPGPFAAARSFGPMQWLAERGLAPDDALGLAAGALFVLSPAAVYDSAVWAQSDGLISFFMLAAILALAGGRVGPAWALWAVGFVIKPQPVVIVPALAAYTYWRFGLRGAATGVAGAAAGAFAMLAYFIFTGNGRYIFDVYRELFKTNDTAISINAWNVWWLGQANGVRASDTLFSAGHLALTVRAASFLLLIVTTLLVLWYLHLRRDLSGLLVSCAMLEFAFFLFPISTHERYLYPLFVFLAPVAVLQWRWMLLYIPLAAVFFLNIYFASPPDPAMLETYLDSTFGIAMAAGNVAAYLLTMAVLLWSIFPRSPPRGGMTSALEPVMV